MKFDYFHLIGFFFVASPGLDDGAGGMINPDN